MNLRGMAAAPSSPRMEETPGIRQKQCLPGIAHVLSPLNKKLLFAIGKTGCDYSVDQGKNWTFIDSTGYYAASAVKGKNIIYLAGSDGRVGRVIVQKE